MSDTLRSLTLDDVDRLVAIDAACYSAPWSRSMFISELVKRSSVGVGAVGEEGELIGYVITSRYVDSWHVMSVAVLPPFRRHGIASVLLERVFEVTREQVGEGYTLEVRVSNVGAIALYEAHGFVQHGLRRAYYTDNREDALIMWRIQEDGANGGGSDG